MSSSTIKQHEPLRTPKGWGEQEKRFIAQLEEVLDDLYSRFGRLKEKDLSLPLRQSIMRSSEGVSDLRQTAKDFTATFKAIGAVEEATGITKIGADGLEVEHTNIESRTKMSADGFSIYGKNGNKIGGLVVIDGKVYLVAQSLMNPSNSNFRIGVAEEDFEGEQMGLHWVFDGLERGTISASNGGMRFDANGDIALYPTEMFQMHSQKGFYLYGPNGSGIEVDDGGKMYLYFVYTDSQGAQLRRSVSMDNIYDAINKIFPE